MYIGRNSKVGALRRIEMLCAQLRAGAACRRSQLCVCRYNVPAQPVTCAGTQVPAHAGCVPVHAGACAGVCRCTPALAPACAGALGANWLWLVPPAELACVPAHPAEQIKICFLH